mgnify:CR=1 FL=1
MSHISAFVGREFGQFARKISTCSSSGRGRCRAWRHCLPASSRPRLLPDDGTVSVLSLRSSRWACRHRRGNPLQSSIERPEIKPSQISRGKTIAISTPGTTTDFTARDRYVLPDSIPIRDITTSSAGDQLPAHGRLWADRQVAGAIVTPPNDLKQRPWDFDFGFQRRLHGADSHWASWVGH